MASSAAATQAGSAYTIDLLANRNGSRLSCFILAPLSAGALILRYDFSSFPSVLNAFIGCFVADLSAAVHSGMVVIARMEVRRRDPVPRRFLW
jgi:hypothetical protein